jgi:hypothetical protein
MACGRAAAAAAAGRALLPMAQVHAYLLGSSEAYTSVLAMQRACVARHMARIDERDASASSSTSTSTSTSTATSVAWPHELIVTEHRPVYTVGRREPAFPLDEQRLRALGADVVKVERGGDVTFHGPGQLVMYPILHLASLGVRHCVTLHCRVISLLLMTGECGSSFPSSATSTISKKSWCARAASSACRLRGRPTRASGSGIARLVHLVRCACAWRTARADPVGCQASRCSGT